MPMRYEAYHLDMRRLSWRGIDLAYSAGAIAWQVPDEEEDEVEHDGKEKEDDDDDTTDEGYSE
jgi:hypothetical protein